MHSIQHDIEVEVPVRQAYNQWTQFEEFPQFMAGVEQVQQRDDQNLHWVTKIAGVKREFDPRITHQEPDAIVSWQSVGDPVHTGTVTFEVIEPARTRVLLRMAYEPKGAIENIGDKLGIVESRISGDLDRFKSFIEERSVATGQWRGEI